MPKHIPSPLPLLIIALSACTSAAAEPKHDIVPEGEYPFWPAYNKVPVDQIEPQPWRTHDDVIDGWDWSLPPSVRVSPRSLLCVSRNMRSLPQVSFEANPVISLWVRWKDLEPEEGRYEFGPLIEDLQKIEAAGYGAIIRPMTAVWESVRYPDPAQTPQRMRDSKKCAPGYLVEKYNVPRIEEKPKTSWRIINLDVTHPDFHRRYLKLVEAIGESGIPRMDVVRGIIVGYASSSWGDEHIGPRDQMDPPHVRERLDAWADACRGVETKVCMGGPSEYGFGKGFGVRGGFVEMYLYQLPERYIGQRIDPAGYLAVDENATIIRNRSFSGDENEEYEESWVHRFGALESFTYRYFTSSLRLLQMRRNYLLNNPFCVYPEMLPFISLEMGRTVEDTPDVWCVLRESRIRASNYQGKDWEQREFSPEEKANGVPVRNFERWLHQRDREGFETSPAVKIKWPIRMWMVPEGKDHDYVARAGKRIGFAIDDRFLDTDSPHRVAVKVTYFDLAEGQLTVHYQTPDGSANRQVPLNATGQLKTATFFLDNALFSADGMDYDLIVEGEPEAVVTMVRVVRL